MPILEPVNPIIVGVLRRAADEQPVPDFLRELVTGPTIAILAEWNFVPLSLLVQAAHGGELGTVPDTFDAILEHVAHVRAVETVEAANGDVAVRVDGQRVVERRTRDASALNFEGKMPLLPNLADAHGVHPFRPELHECLTLVAVAFLESHGYADAGKRMVAARGHQQFDRLVKQIEPCNAANFLQGFRRDRVHTEKD